MTYDAHKNFAYGLVLTPPNPANSGTTLVLGTGFGNALPATPFNGVVWPVGQQPSTTNAEIVRVTNVSSDSLTITRAQESTSARTIVAGDQFAAAITAKTITDVEAAAAASLQPGNNLSDVANAATARTNLGLGTAATQASSAFDAAGAAAAAQTASLQKTSNLSDVANSDSSRANLTVPTLRHAQCVATTNQALSGALPTIDGYAVQDSDRVLLSAQSTGSQNGPWVAHTAGWARPNDYPSGASLTSRSMKVTGGTVYAGTDWVLVGTSPITIDTSSATWQLTTVVSSQLPASVVNERSGIWRPPAWGQFWLPKLAAAQAGAGKAVMAVVGDSTSDRVHYPSVLSKSWTELVRASLQGANASAGDGGSGFMGINQSGVYQSATGYAGFAAQHAGDGLLVGSSGTWTVGGNFDGPGAVQLQSNVNASTLTFQVRGTTVTVYYLKWNNGQFTFTGAPITVTIDGVAQTQIVTDNGASAAAVTSTTYSGLAAGTHTVVITNNSGGASAYAFIYGVSGENANGVVVNNFAAGSRKSADYVATVAPAVGTAAAWSGGQNYPADLVIYGLSANDANTNVAPDTWLTNFALAMNQIKSGTGGRQGATDVILLLPHIGQYDGTSNDFKLYVTRARAIAEAYGAAIVNFWPMGRNNWTYWNSLGFWGNAASAGASGTDTIHLSDLGHAYMSSIVQPLIATGI